MNEETDVINNLRALMVAAATVDSLVTTFQRRYPQHKLPSHILDALDALGHTAGRAARAIGSLPKNWRPT